MSTETGSPDEGKDQIRDESDHPETEVAGDVDQLDLRHDVDGGETLPPAGLRHNEASLLAFLDRPLPLDSALSLGSAFLAEPEEKVAEIVDSLVSKGLLRFADNQVERSGVTDEYNTLVPGSSQSQLDAEASPEDPMEEAYKEWNAIAARHPEWRLRVKREFGNAPISVNPEDPHALDSMRGKLEYVGVAENDLQEFARFLELDDMIEKHEAEGGFGKGASIRAQRLYRMAGGKVSGVGIFRSGVRAVRAAELGHGDLIQALAEEIAERDYGCDLSSLPLDQQMTITQRAEQDSIKRFPLTTKADFGMPDAGDDGSPPPAPDPEKAPQGWDKITGPDGKATYRSKTDPNVKLERTDPNAV